MADFKGTIGTVPEELRGSLSSDLSLSGKLSSLGIPGNGIASIEKTSTDGLTDTYTITYDDGATTNYQITNGNGIASAVFNDDNTLTISFDDGTELTTGVLRGDDGEKVLLKAENNVVSYTYESDPNWTTLVDLTGFADDASNAADRANAKAEEARQSAIRAENSASDANASAGIATTKAEEAASSEEQAGISMRRAETAASDALASKNLAQEAAATAITAQDNSRIYSERTLGYANNAAQSAQSASNSAASAAQSATGLSEAVASAQQSAREAAGSATQAQEYYDGIDEVAVQAMEDYLDAHPAVQSVNGKTRHVVLNAADVGALPSSTFIPSKITDLTNDSDFATNGDLAELQTKLNTLADSDDQTLDQLSEIVAYIKNNKNLIDGITTGKVSVSDIVDNLTSTATNKPLSAKQGKELKDLIDAIVIPTNVSAFMNDAGYLTEHQDISGKQDVISDLATIRSGAALGATALQAETDPTVPAWAKATTKPSYTAVEVGALPSDTYIPTKVSDLTNDAGYLTEHQDISGKANTADLATVATSGSYTDLTNKPSIPTKTSQLTNDSDFADESYVNQAITDAIADIVGVEYRVCGQGEYNPNTYLPTIEGEPGVIYLVPKPNPSIGNATIGESSVSGNNIYYEFIYNGQSFEMIGDTQVSLAGYLQESDISTNAEVQSMLTEVFGGE